MSYGQYRRQIAELRKRIDTGTTQLLMPDGTQHDLPGEGDYFIRLFHYAGQLAHGALPAEARRPRYEAHVAWLREAVEIKEPPGNELGGVVQGWLRILAKTADSESAAPGKGRAVIGAGRVEGLTGG